MAPLNPKAAEFSPFQDRYLTVPPSGYLVCCYYYYPITTLVPFSYEQGYQQQQQQKEHHGYNQRRVKKVWRKKGEQEAETAVTFLELNDNDVTNHPVMPMRRDGHETTVMIRNIPGKYTDMLLEFLESHCKKENKRAENDGVGKENEAVLAFDFVYLPVDFRSGLNKGYAFVNFTKSEAAWRFFKTASNKKWEKFQSYKVREIVAARVQGKDKLEDHFGTMTFPWRSVEVLPVVFSPPRDGVIKGEMRTIGKLVKP